MHDSTTSDPAAADRAQPRAIIHKQILETAEANPDASIETIAEMVSGASEQIVGRVLDEYGDPAASETQTGQSNDEDDSGPAATADGADDPPTDDGPEGAAAESATTPTTNDSTPTTIKTDGAGSVPETAADVTSLSGLPEAETGPQSVADPATLTPKQREALEAVHRDPTATQREIAEQLGVSRATISKRVNDVPGFEWKCRREFVERLFSGDSGQHDDQQVESSPTAAVEELATRVDALEEQLQTQRTSETDVQLGSELAAKVVHACMDAEYVSEEEELELLSQLL